MQINVKFFAMLRERVGRTNIFVVVPDGSTVGDLWRAIQEDYPTLAGIDIKLLYAVNSSYVDARHELRDGDEVVFVPPVSGGSECIG